MHFARTSLLRCSLLSATALASAFSFAGTASAQNSAVSTFGLQPVSEEQIVANHEVPTGPANVLPGTVGANNGSIYSNSPQVLDARGSITGIGQQIAFIQTSPTAAGLSLCSGTLINPRTVITAAHCVYNNPAHRYGSNTGTGGGVNGNFGTGGAPLTSQGIPYSFGFESLNRNCFNAAGLPFTCPAGQKGPYETWRDSNFQTVESRHIYNANQIWYGTGAQPVALGGLGEFANQDIALATLDTHVEDIPTWTMLFSPLDGPTHSIVTGYGTAGVGLSGIGALAGIDYRRRSAENMIDALFSSKDWGMSDAIGGGAAQFGALTHPIYWNDFDDPDHDPNNLPANFFTNVQPGPNPPRNNGYYDFNGLGGHALLNEGNTGGGDSGGPLIVDERFARDVIVGVLTGSWSFNSIVTYGSFSVYPPLFQFWEDIVQNNPYKYASALAGDGDWMDPTHWVQDMDPNYAIIDENGDLATGIPDHAQGGADGTTERFGTVCFLEVDCNTFTGPGLPVGTGTPHLTAGGPGTLNFVPNNVEPVNSAIAANHVKARYYDVTLREAGATTLGQAVTIDMMTVNGAQSQLRINSGGNLRVLSDFTQMQGWTHVDGVLRAREALFATGFLSGDGTLEAPFTTVAAAVVAPGTGGTIGELDVTGNLILASASSLFVDIRRGAGDLLDVSGILDLGGGSVVFNKLDAAAPRHGDSWVIAEAGDVNGTFGTIYSFQGVLRPELTYTDTRVTARLRAGSLVEIIDGSGPIELAFAAALDRLRTGHYFNLYELYGIVDLMDGPTLSMTLRGLAPTIATESQSLQERQGRLMLNGIVDRLSSLGTGPTGVISVNGSPAQTLATAQGSAPTSAVAGLVPSSRPMTALPPGMTGFVNSGYVTDASATGVNRLGVAGGRHIAYANMGLEGELSDRLIVGTAFGYAYGFSAPGAERAEARTSQLAAYGSYRLGGGAYVAGLASAEISRTSMERQVATGNLAYDLYGAGRTSRFETMVEAGTNLDFANGLTLTPRAALAYSRYSMGGFDERGGEAALRLNEIGIERLETRLGARLTGQTRLGGWQLAPQLAADVVHTLSGANHGLSVSFANVPDIAFLLPLANGDSSWAELRGGFTLSRGPLSFGAGIETSIARAGFQDDRARADVTLRF